MSDENETNPPLGVRADAEFPSASMPSGTPAILVAIWAEVLKLHPGNVGLNDNFFDLGGHSLLATQIASRYKRATGRDLPLFNLFRSPTIAALSIELDAIAAAKPDREQLSRDVASMSDDQVELLLRRNVGMMNSAE